MTHGKNFSQKVDVLMYVLGIFPGNSIGRCQYGPHRSSTANLLSTLASIALVLACFPTRSTISVTESAGIGSVQIQSENGVDY